MIEQMCSTWQHFPCQACLQKAVEQWGYDWAEWQKEALRIYNNAKVRKSRQKHLERRRQADREWKKRDRLENPEKQRAIARRSYAKNGERQNAKRRGNPVYQARAKEAMARRRKERPHIDKAISERWQAAHGAAYREKNKERLRAYFKEYQKKHPEKGLARVRKRNALKKAAAVNDFTAAQWKAIKAHYKFRCVYCGEKPKRLTMDHITPLAKGGNHTASNIVPSCFPCNRKKATKAAPVPVQPLLFAV